MKILFYTCNIGDHFFLSSISAYLDQTRSDEVCGGQMTVLKSNLPWGH